MGSIDLNALAESWKDEYFPFGAEKPWDQFKIQTVEKFVKFLNSHNRADRITPGMIKVYFEHLKNQVGYSGGTRENTKTAFRSFFEFLEENEAISPFFSRKIQQQDFWKRQKREAGSFYVRRIYESELMELLHKMHEDSYLSDSTYVPVRRFTCWFAFQFALGQAELQSIKVNEIDFESGVIKIKRQKTNAKITLPIYDPNRQIPYITRFLELRAQFLKEKQNEHVYLIFNSHTGAALQSMRSYYDFIKKMFTDTPWQKKGTHWIRKSGASRLYYDLKWNIVDVSRFMGHSDTQVTLKYIVHDMEEYLERTRKATAQASRLKIVSQGS
ncbi:MAG: tyrosine-type recombinase/integrase [Promethearchaeota archaeon]